MSARFSSSDAQKDMNGEPCRRKSNENRGVQNAPVLLEGVSGYFNVPLSRMRQLDKWNCPRGFRNRFLVRRRNSLRMSPGKVAVDGFGKELFLVQGRGRRYGSCCGEDSAHRQGRQSRSVPILRESRRAVNLFPYLAILRRRAREPASAAPSRLSVPGSGAPVVLPTQVTVVVSVNVEPDPVLLVAVMVSTPGVPLLS